MSDELKQVQILFEQINSNVKAIAEGHSVIRNEIQEFRTEINSRFDQEVGDIKNAVTAHSRQLKEINQTVNEIKQDLKVHIRQSAPPAHVAV